MTRHVLSWMDDRVHANTIQGLRDAWRDRTGKNADTTPGWLGLTAEEAQEGDSLQIRLSSLLDGVEGGDVAALSAVLAERHATDPASIDALELRLARRTGTDMLAALCIQSELQDMVPKTAFIPIVRGPARRVNLIIMSDGARISMAVPLSTEVSWSDGHLTIQRVLPQTFQMAVINKPLTQVVSHPLLDPLGLTIDDIETLNGRETRFKTGYRRDTVSAISLTHEDLASDETALDTPPPSRRAPKSTLTSPF